jgi:hypothetical protein
MQFVMLCQKQGQHRQHNYKKNWTKHRVGDSGNYPKLIGLEGGKTQRLPLCRNTLGAQSENCSKRKFEKEEQSGNVVPGLTMSLQRSQQGLHQQRYSAKVLMKLFKVSHSGKCNGPRPFTTNIHVLKQTNSASNHIGKDFTEQRIRGYESMSKDQ